MTRGGVFHDDLGELTRVRAELARVSGRRCGSGCSPASGGASIRRNRSSAAPRRCGDDLGSRVLAARLARDVMLLCFRLERAYAPYPKWFGTAFARLDAAARSVPRSTRALGADAIDDREAGLVDAYEAVARRHNALGVTDSVDPTARPFHGRPFRVIGRGRFVDACLARVDRRAAARAAR